MGKVQGAGGERFAPTGDPERIRNLDVIRGFATLGTFFVSAVAYGLPHAAFFNLSSPGSNGPIDWAVAVLGEIFFDQKALALLAMVFGAGIVIFAERAKRAGNHPVRSTLWRSVWLFWLGVPVGMHGLLWEGTSLWFFGFFIPLPLLVRNRSPKVLLIAGALLVGFSALLAVLFQGAVPDEIERLGQYWVTGVHGTDEVEGMIMFLPLEILFRLLGTMIIGVALAKLGVVQGLREADFYRRLTVYGLSIGVPLATASVFWRAAGDYGTAVAVVGEAPNTLAAVPMALGYVGLITWWGKRTGRSAMIERVAAVGRMALTNSIVQTGFGIAILRDGVLERGQLDRTGIAGLVIVIWAVQLLWSKLWLDRFRFGPFEWVIRSLTYRSFQPVRRPSAASQS